MSTMHRNRFVALLFFVLATFFLIIPPIAAQAALPSVLETIHLDWVCVTDATLVDAYSPLVAHRENQGLATLVVSLEEVIRWSPAGDDTTASLRWLATVANEQWGARYLLLGGSHALLPAPIHRLTTPYQVYDHPTDAYYACLDGDWDVDGDGFVAEWDEDAAQPTVHLCVGRLPADDAEAVANAVAKIIAFEERSPAVAGGALFVSSLMDINFEPDDPYPNWALAFAAALRDTALVYDPSLRAGTLFQGPDPQYPDTDPLNAEALVDSLGARVHDFVFMQLHGIATVWELVVPRMVSAHSFEPLADVDHSFLLTMLSGPIGDTRGEGVLKYLMTMPGGGAAAAIVPSGVGYYLPMRHFQFRLWANMLDQSHARLGNVFDSTRAAFIADLGFANRAYASTYWNQALFGDPATIVRPISDLTSDTPPSGLSINLRAVPNPFNPSTEISFEVSHGNGGPQPVHLEIVDLRGRRVATLLDGVLLPGPHAVAWNAQEASGIYFARVTVDGRTETVKLTLVE